MYHKITKINYPTSIKDLSGLGDPASKIHEIAERTEVDIIVMGLKGLGNTYHEMGHVGQKVLNLTSKPVLFLK